MSFTLRTADKQILLNRFGLSKLFVSRLESVLEQADDATTDLEANDITATGGITATGNITTSGSISDANGTVKPFKRYTALLTQTSTNAPVATVLKNELSVTPTWGYTSTGVYTCTATGLFTSAKTVISLGAQLDLLNNAKAIHTSANVVTVTTSVLSESANVLIQTPTNGLLSATLIDILVFD